MIAYDRGSDGLVELTVDGEVTRDDVRGVFARLMADIGEDERVRIVENVARFEGIGPAAIWEDLRLGVPLWRRIGRVAVVADRGWVKAAVGFGRHFVAAELRHFPPGEIAAARAWARDG